MKAIALAALIPGCVQTDGFESTAQAIKTHCKAGDLVLTLGCGDVYKCAYIMAGIK